jgi:hypothetical protein
MQDVKRRIGSVLVLAVALVALAAFGVASSAMATTTSKHKGVKQAAKHVAKTKGAKHARLLAATKSAKSATSSETPTSAPETESSTEAAGAPESAADTAAQDAACKAAGIDPNGNVQFDDATNTCSLDTGGTDSQQQ